MFAKLFSLHRLLGLLSVTAAMVYLFFKMDDQFSNACYMSEKALSPGVIEEQFASSNEISEYYRQAKQIYKQDNLENGKFQAWLEKELFNIGLDSYTHNFSFAFPMILGEQRLQGSNVAGILRAYRAARTEALILVAPLRAVNGPETPTTGSVALMLALAKFFRRQTYWAKDIIFLFTEMEVVGLQAWLHAYHGQQQQLQPSVQAAELQHWSGSVQAALCFDFDELSFGQPGLHIEGVNGILPNLDLVNTIVRIGHKHRMEFTMHPKHQQQHRMSSPQQSALNMLLRQASGSPASLHGLFLPFDIPAVGISGRAVGRSRWHTLPDTARVVEGVCRSLNNLQERLHQSFFFYVLPRLHRYVSIGDYMPAMGLSIIGLLLSACHTLAQRVFPSAAGTQPPKLPSLWPIGRICVLAWGFGLFAFLAPNYFVRLSASFRIDPGAGLLIGLLAVQFVSAAYPRFFRTSQLLLCDRDFLRLATSLITAASLGAVSLLNFGLGFGSACALVPAWLISCSTLPKPLWLMAIVYDLIVSPVGLVLIGCLLANGGQSLAESWTCAEYGVLQAVVEETLLGSWTFRLFSLILMPCWLLIWSQLFAYEGEGEGVQVEEGEKVKEPISDQASEAANAKPKSPAEPIRVKQRAAATAASAAAS